MTTKDIIKDMEKVFDEKFGLRGVADIVFKPQIDKFRDFIFNYYTRTLLESFGEEIIGQDEKAYTSSKEANTVHGHMDWDKERRNNLRAEQRLKKKEILSNLK